MYKREIGARLRMAREAIGLHQAAMARGLGIGRDKLNGYERGRFFPDPVIVHHMWRLYGITADWLYLGLLAGLPHSLAARLDAVEEASSQG